MERSSSADWLRKLADYKWSLLALGMLFGALLLTRGGLASLAPLLRIIAPLAVVVVLFKLVKKKLLGAAQEAFRKQMEGGQGFGRPPGGGFPRGGQQGSGPVIDLCGKCGGYLRPGHRCQT